MYDKYTVGYNETLSDIAKRFNTTVDELKTINNLSTSSLYEGDKLKIPQYK